MISGWGDLDLLLKGFLLGVGEGGRVVVDGGGDM